MADKDIEFYENRANMLKALAHPLRLKIIEELCINKTNVTNIYTKLNVPQSTVSRHLAVLKNAGIVKSSRNKLEMNYYIDCPNIEPFVKSVIKKDII